MRFSAAMALCFLLALPLWTAAHLQELKSDTPARQGNLLNNASFEDHDAAASIPTHWTSEVMATNGDSDAASRITLDADDAFTGSASLQLSGEASTVRWQAAMQAGLDVVPGQRYRLSAWMRTEDVRRERNQYINNNVFAQFRDADGAVLRDANGYPVSGTSPLMGTHGWTRVERVLRAPDGAASVSVGCFLSCAGTSWFDAVSFEPLVAPDWHRQDTGRYVYHWEEESGPPAMVIRANQDFLEQLEQLLQTRLEQPVQYYYYEDNARKAAVTGMAGNAHVEGADEIHSIFWTDRHEIGHLLTRRWGRGTALLAEGLAVYLSGSWHAEPVDVAARSMLAAKALLPLSEIVTTTGFRSHDDLVTYPQAGSFAKHLFETYGLQSYSTLYSKTPIDPSAEDFDALLDLAFGKDLAALEAEWLAALSGDDSAR